MEDRMEVMEDFLDEGEEELDANQFWFPLESESEDSEDQGSYISDTEEEELEEQGAMISLRIYHVCLDCSQMGVHLWSRDM